MEIIDLKFLTRVFENLQKRPGQLGLTQFPVLQSLFVNINNEELIFFCQTTQTSWKTAGDGRIHRILAISLSLGTFLFSA